MKKLNQKGFGLIESLLIIIALTLIVFVGFYIVSNRKSNDTRSAQTTAAKDKTASASDTKSSQAPDTIDYDPAVDIYQSSDAAQLKGAPQDLKDYFEAHITQEQADQKANGADGDCKWSYSVSKIYKSNFVIGGIGADGCGGAQAIWAKKDGQWQKAFASQQIVECTTVDNYKIPKAIYPQCFDGNENIVDNTNE